MSLAMILAMSENKTIGKNNTMPWHLSDELKRFKQITTGHTIIMGRKTFESFPKPLPNRKHIVITRQTNYQAPDGVVVVNSLQDAIKQCDAQGQAFIIGGAQIYDQAYDLCDKLYLTIIHAKIEGDTSFEKINLNDWQTLEEQSYSASEKNDHDFTCYVYQRQK